METLINRTTWFGLSAIGATFLGISVLFSFLGFYIIGVEMMGFFKWILYIFFFGTGIIGALIALGAIAVGLKMRFSSNGETAEE
ncbi:hypothetical protein [Jeotgalibacillus proteolyticus]|uniref:Uncharacterized protein n=1 Tax=Jeotgalibacillus proteolyticus TaxID=2082395 RepID=A0A2S5GB63_9BACL|nr:hypothetical protein [Jeotgalibacillus proteolyticus]PPA70208.1 hypothetical protein C4B60_11530 [Jeotgalibacillus proteolyticus]